MTPPAKSLTPEQFRLRCRDGSFESNSAGYCPGFAQVRHDARTLILPKEHAFDFLLFCQRNPKPCPLLEVSDPGCVDMRRFAPNSDIRTDLPKYRVYKHGVLTDEVIDIKPYWRDVSTVVITQYHVKLDNFVGLGDVLTRLLVQL
ncbi:hypothetical protein DYB30_002634 [Aphanomyces astaci]|uniref:Uncharacterized protein n=1 Tax=Aphanomyces astaci TaxID=112090 RepID=A0A397CA46_APHAT|nr:hypothetical protein DYB30_002634 [Aphanomyces astaci]